MNPFGEWPFGDQEPFGRWRRDDTPGGSDWSAHLRPVEMWEEQDEYYDGETVLDDLRATDSTEREQGRVLARFIVVRLALGAAYGALPPETLELERAAAEAYVRRPSAVSREAEALTAVIRLSTPMPCSELGAALCDAAACAAVRGHENGACALYRAAYELGVDWGWWAEAGRAAGALATLARDGGGAWSQRLWRRRARVLDRRAARGRSEG